MASIELRQVKKTYGALDVIKGIDLDIKHGEFCVFVGPSGCGKSTLLRMISGLEELSGGDIIIGGDVVNAVPAADRGLAMVFQSYALYPHMTVYDNMAFGLRNIGLSDKDIRARITEAARMLEISPGLAKAHLQLGWAYYFARQYDDALVQFQKGLEMNANAELVLYIAWAYREKGMYKEALAEFLKVKQIVPGFSKVVLLGHSGNAYARAGNQAEAQKAIQELIELSKQRRGTWEVALIYAGLGDKDRAFEWLEKAYNMHDKGMVYLKVDPPLDPLRSDPRFMVLLRRMNFPP